MIQISSCPIWTFKFGSIWKDNDKIRKFAIEICVNLSNFWLIWTNFPLKDDFNVQNGPKFKIYWNGPKSQNLLTYLIDFDFFKYFWLNSTKFLPISKSSIEFRHIWSILSRQYGLQQWIQIKNLIKDDLNPISVEIWA